jgi:cob(I)alamin adenosyltransferase
MGNRLTKVYTRGLADGSRRSKNDPRVHCMGEVDELNACLGLALSLLDDGPLQQLLFSVQHDLFDVGAELCQPGKQLITDDYVKKSADEFNARLDELREFILPGGSQAVASLHLARTVCRRVERGLVTLGENEIVNPVTSRYINRLSDLLFILARAQSQSEDGGEVYWNSKYSRLNRASD